MPKRMLDSSMLGPGSLTRCSPRAQDGWPRLILVADDFGCTEAHPVWLKGQGWSLRVDVTIADIASWLLEWSRAGMLFLWEEEGRFFGYLTGWHGKHGQRWRVEYDPDTVEGLKGSKRRTPPPPGWTGQRPRPWAPPAGYAPGEVWGARPVLAGENLSLFTPGREDFSRRIPGSAVPVPVPDAVSLLPAQSDSAQLALPGGPSDTGLAETAPPGGRFGVTPNGSDTGLAEAAKTARPGGRKTTGPEEIPPDAPPLARWLAEKYPDVKDPVAFTLAQADACPGIDLLAEAKKALAWEVANPKNRKRQHGRFLAGWFSRAQDRASANGRGTGPPRNAKPRCFALPSDMTGVSGSDYLKPPRSPNGVP